MENNTTSKIFNTSSLQELTVSTECLVKNTICVQSINPTFENAIFFDFGKHQKSNK